MTTSELVLTLAGAHGVAGSEGKAAGLARERSEEHTSELQSLSC